MEMNKYSNEKKHSSSLWLIRLMKPYIWRLCIVALLIVLANLADLMKPRIYATLIDDYLRPAVASKPTTSGSNVLSGTLWRLGISYFSVILVSAVSSLIQSHMVTSICQRILHETRLKLFHHIHHMKLKDLDAQGSGRLLTRATNDVESLDEFYGDVLSGLFRDMFLLVGIVIMMFSMNSRLALSGFAAVPFIILIYN